MALHTAWKRRLGALALLAGMVIGATACNRRMLAVFFDIPVEQVGAAAKASAGTARDSVSTATTVPDATPAAKPFAPFGGSLAEDSVVPKLPRDHAGNVDWSAALRSGVVRPVATLSGVDSASTRLLRFTFDFFLPPGDDTTVTTWFPHTGHTEWMNCNSCHVQLFPYRRPVKMSMDALSEGKYCGACHGPVAFPMETGCERCHPKEELTAGEAPPALLGTIRLRRVSGDTLDPPRSIFRHWVHRARYVCSTCHDQLFAMKAGKAAVSMDLISQGKSCGVCHDGKRAFSADFEACDRCHVPPKRPAK
jgi:c(7)-type cytochrome triheme protein